MLTYLLCLSTVLMVVTVVACMGTLYLPTYSVWSWGWGVHGQLGLQSVDDKFLPCHTPLLEGKQVSFIVAGYGHSAVLTAEVCCYGYN